MGLLRKIQEKRERNKDSVGDWRKKGCNIGENCSIYPTVSFGSEPYLITIGNHVRIGNNVNFVTHDGGAWVAREYDKTLKEADLFGKITVGNNVHIGMNVTVMPNVTIGDNCIIGCGAIVTKDIPANSVAVGVPARVIESIDTYIEKHRSDFCFTKSLTGLEKKKAVLKYFEERERAKQ